MEGTFELLGPIELLQLISQSNQTGVFRVEDGEIYLENGRPIHAQYRDLKGKQAFFQILALKESDFRFIENHSPEIKTLDGPIENYLLQAIQFIDVKISISPFDLIQLTDQNKATHLTLANEDFEILKHISAPTSLIEICRKSGVSLETSTSSIARLARIGLIDVNKRTPGTIRLTVEKLDTRGHEIKIDSEIFGSWRHHFGSFSNAIFRSSRGDFQAPLTTGRNLGSNIAFSKDALTSSRLEVGQEVLVWPAL